MSLFLTRPGELVLTLKVVQASWFQRPPDEIATINLKMCFSIQDFKDIMVYFFKKNSLGLDSK